MSAANGWIDTRAAWPLWRTCNRWRVPTGGTTHFTFLPSETRLNFLLPGVIAENTKFSARQAAERECSAASLEASAP